MMYKTYSMNSRRVEPYQWFRQ